MPFGFCHDVIKSDNCIFTCNREICRIWAGSIADKNSSLAPMDFYPNMHMAANIVPQVLQQHQANLLQHQVLQQAALQQQSAQQGGNNIIKLQA
eukprot:6415595-Ditylum_brightwellii.AAC.1